LFQATQGGGGAGEPRGHLRIANPTQVCPHSFIGGGGRAKGRRVGFLSRRPGVTSDSTGRRGGEGGHSEQLGGGGDGHDGGPRGGAAGPGDAGERVAGKAPSFIMSSTPPPLTTFQPSPRCERTRFQWRQHESRGGSRAHHVAVDNRAGVRGVPVCAVRRRRGAQQHRRLDYFLYAALRCPSSSQLTPLCPCIASCSCDTPLYQYSWHHVAPVHFIC
jgi:hypothetical protein